MEKGEWKHVRCYIYIYYVCIYIYIYAPPSKPAPAAYNGCCLYKGCQVNLDGCSEVGSFQCWQTCANDSLRLCHPYKKCCFQLRKSVSFLLLIIFLSFHICHGHKQHLFQRSLFFGGRNLEGPIAKGSRGSGGAGSRKPPDRRGPLLFTWLTMQGEQRFGFSN